MSTDAFKVESATAARLGAYDVFSPETIAIVSEVAAEQATYKDYRSMFDKIGLKDPEPFLAEGYCPTEVIDIRRENEAGTLFMLSSMGNGISQQKSVDIATVAMANPNTRIVFFPSPGSLGSRAGVLNIRQRRSAIEGCFKPATALVARFAVSRGITQIDLEGGSLGGDLVPGAAQHMDYKVGKAIVNDPSGTDPWFFPHLVKNFLASGKTLNDYKDLTDLAVNQQAVKDSKGWTRWFGGLVRASNIALARGIATGRHEEQVGLALMCQPGMTAHYTVGTNSELVDPLLYPFMIKRLQKQNPGRVFSTELEGAHHPWANDLHLHAATIVEARGGVR